MDNPERMLIGKLPIVMIVLIVPILFMLAYLGNEIHANELYEVILDPGPSSPTITDLQLFTLTTPAGASTTEEKIVANATANATGELMSRANNVLSLASGAASNATEIAMNKTMNLLNNVSSNVSDTMSNVSATETDSGVNEEANELINAASNAFTNATTETDNILSNASSDLSGEIQNTTSNPLQGKFSNHTSSPYQIQFQYPRIWELTEKTSRFDEGSDIMISSYSPSAFMLVQYLNSSLLQGSDLQSMLYDFFKSSIEGDYSREYKIIEQPSFTTINDQKAGTYLYTNKDKYEELATRWATQNWVVRVGDHGYLISFSTSTDLFDSTDMKNNRDQFIKSIKFLGITNQTDSSAPNRFD